MTENVTIKSHVFYNIAVRQRTEHVVQHFSRSIVSNMSDNMFPLYFFLKRGRIIKTPQTLDGHKIAYFATVLTNMRLSKPCKFHWSTRYHTYVLHVQQDGRVSVLTPPRLRRVGVSVYTSIKCVFARTAVLSTFLSSTWNFEAFLILHKNSNFKNKNLFFSTKFW